MLIGRLAACLPYVACLGVAVALWLLTGQITFDQRAGQLGPAFWPRVAIVIMAAAAAIEIIRKLVSPSPDREISGVGEVLESSAEDGDDAPRVPPLLLGAMALTLGYGLAVNTLGFVTTTFLFLVAFMYLGRYRNHAVIWLSALLGTLLFAVVFLKIVYVSLPRGTPPFDRVTQGVLDLFGWL